MDRRRFLASLGGGSAAGLAWPDSLAAVAARLRDRRRDTQAFWDEVRAAFFIPDDRIYLNVGTLGPQPDVVLAAVSQHAHRVAQTFPPRTDWDVLKAEVGSLLGGDAPGFVFPRNTTEAMSFVANGLDLRSGDEVVTTAHEHIGGVSCWELAAARRGVRLVRVSLSDPPEGPAEWVDRFRDAFSGRTRVLSVSHVTFTNGRVLPVSALAVAARERGITVVVDGAHPPGLMPVGLDDLGVDFYASSPHKWLLAPQGTGLLHVAPRWRERIWPSVASGGWDDTSLGAHRLNHLGTLDESRLAGLLAAIRFHRAIGPETVYARIRTLRRRLIDQLSDIPAVEIHSHTADAQSAGMVSFTRHGISAPDLQRRLAEQAGVRTRVVGEYGLDWMRLSPHVYNSESDIDRVAELVARAA